MSDAPEDPRLPPEPGGGGDDDDTNPIEPAAELPAEPPYDAVDLPPLAPLGDDLPPLDGDGEPPQRRLLSGGRLAAVAVAALVLLGGAAYAVTSGDDDSDNGDDGIASVDGSEGDDNDDTSGNSEGPSEEEFQDALLEYAQCIRENGVDMPDPEFNANGGGIAIGGGPGGDGGGPSEEEWRAADGACSSIMEGVRGEMTPPSAEEMAEMQDKLVAMAQCIRDRGYDMPDPQISADGGIEISIGNRGDGGFAGPQTGEEEEFAQDQEECNEEAGMDGFGGGPMRSTTDGGDS